MKKTDKLNEKAVKIMAELSGCFEDNENGSQLINNDNYEQDVKDFIYALVLTTGVLIKELTGNDGDNIDTLSLLTRIVFEYSNQES